MSLEEDKKRLISRATEVADLWYGKMMLDPMELRTIKWDYEQEVQKASKELLTDRDFGLSLASIWGPSLEFFDQALRVDKDFVLECARSFERESAAKACYEKADPSLKEAITCQDFEAAAASALAIKGQVAPVVSIMLSRTDKEGSSVFLCEASLVSGTAFTCELADDASDGARPSPSVNDLVTLLLAELPKHLEATHTTKYIFLSLQKEEGDSVLLTPWDCNRPLSSFV
mmetsp:Transcript_87172/g.182427  ORF Transcript_87172/g.182427 Transcript_87172/m.182427 type:complete len:230 (-) Transcript_87172:151-840(-)|eukprot:CAMPEP_0206472534 /NCGR_PEP_ID=MMETSP0324_2-20121206/32259_1 /ASSEMBLY_ACC=CAM_ASM_000836 /TAXON_ID=2866 /ORGANISM="Crypthecodinium cohnii, Strain Seligo" /LENGTH=229 /DNA_ID=CAMNT_0053947155 /DNA_START=83 /DNA_END=772 /DNA_ORIENTATION=-